MILYVAVCCKLGQCYCLVITDLLHFSCAALQFFSFLVMKN